MDFLSGHLNVLSTLMTAERFAQIMNDEDLSEEQRFWGIANRLGNYEIIWSNSEWNNKIESLKAEYQPLLIDHIKKSQDGFNILFDYERFLTEIKAVSGKYDVISSDLEQRLKFWQEDHVNESVSNFIWHYGERDDSKKIVMAEVVKKASDPAIFNEFLFQQLDNYLRQKVDISEEQYAKIGILISDWVDNLDRCRNIHLLGRLIEAYNVQLTDKQLLSLLPYSYVTIKTNAPTGLSDNSIDNSLLQHIYDNISDKKLVVAEIDRILSESKHLSPPLFEKFTDFIVREKIVFLYNYFEKMLFSEVEEGWQGGYYSDYPLRIANTILKLGQKGLQILDSLKGKLNDRDRLYYYQMILSNDNLKLHNLTEIAADIHNINEKAISNDEIELTLSLLSKLGDVEGLRMIVDYYRINPTCFCYNRPTLVDYGHEHIDFIKQIFEISYTLDTRERSEMRDSAFNWLNQYAMQSPENRDAIIDYYTQLAETNPTKYSPLLRVSRNLYNKYFEENSPDMPIADAVRLYASTQKGTIVDRDNTLSQPRPAVKPNVDNPTVCISYSWDDEDHKQWVLDLADKLTANGIHVHFDRYDLVPGSDSNHFMEEMLAKSEKVLVVVTPTYKEKAEKRKSGAGYEFNIISSEIFEDQGSTKFIPIKKRDKNYSCANRPTKQDYHYDAR